MEGLWLTWRSVCVCVS